MCVFYTSPSPWYIGKLTSRQMRADTKIKIKQLCQYVTLDTIHVSTEKKLLNKNLDHE